MSEQNTGTVKTEKVYEYPKGYSYKTNPRVTLDELISDAVQKAEEMEKSVTILKQEDADVSVPVVKSDELSIWDKALALTDAELKGVTLTGTLSKGKYAPEVYLRALIDFNILSAKLWSCKYGLPRYDSGTMTNKYQALRKVLLSLNVSLRDLEVICEKAKANGI